jgi:hypothetical protein
VHRPGNMPLFQVNALDSLLDRYRELMHTVLIIAGGFALLGACLLVAKLAGTSAALASAALIFLPLWLIGAGLNMRMGVSKAGYSVRDELPIFLLVFAVPAAAALFLWWKFRTGS